MLALGGEYTLFFLPAVPWSNHKLSSLFISASVGGAQDDPFVSLSCRSPSLSSVTLLLASAAAGAAFALTLLVMRSSISSIFLFIVVTWERKVCCIWEIIISRASPPVVVTMDAFVVDGTLSLFKSAKATVVMAGDEGRERSSGLVWEAVGEVAMLSEKPGGGEISIVGGSSAEDGMVKVLYPCCWYWELNGWCVAIMMRGTNHQLHLRLCTRHKKARPNQIVVNPKVCAMFVLLWIERAKR